MTIAAALSRLSGVRKAGEHRWYARCPAHEDTTPSLSITLGAEGRVLMHCFAGCAIDEICDAANIPLSELFPPKIRDHAPAVRWPHMPEQVFRLLQAETAIVYLIACDMAKHRGLSAEDFVRLAQAGQRIGNISTAYE